MRRWLRWWRVPSHIRKRASRTYRQACGRLFAQEYLRRHGDSAKSAEALLVRSFPWSDDFDWGIAQFVDGRREEVVPKVVSAVQQRDEARALAEEACARYNELLAERHVSCVFCGHRYEEGTPESQDERLVAHILTCEKHPLSGLLSAARGLLAYGPPQEGSNGYRKAWEELQEACRAL